MEPQPSANPVGGSSARTTVADHVLGVVFRLVFVLGMFAALGGPLPVTRRSLLQWLVGLGFSLGFLVVGVWVLWRGPSARPEHRLRWVIWGLACISWGTFAFCYAHWPVLRWLAHHGVPTLPP